MMSGAIVAARNIGVLRMLQQPVGLEGNQLQKSLAGPCFIVFPVHRITIDPQNCQNPSSPSHSFASILQVPQVGWRTGWYHSGSILPRYLSIMRGALFQIYLPLDILADRLPERQANKSRSAVFLIKWIFYEAF
jgi:hypothetical protein